VREDFAACRKPAGRARRLLFGTVSGWRENGRTLRVGMMLNNRQRGTLKQIEAGPDAACGAGGII
jgi:hypothetical protein